MCQISRSGPESWVVPFNVEESVGELRAVMLFADFPDVPPNAESTQQLYDLAVPGAQAWFETVSRGRFTLTVDAVHQWYMAPDSSDTYDASTYDGHRRYIADIAALADADVDFSSYDAIFVVAKGGSRQGSSYANPGFDFQLDGVEIRSGVTFGESYRLGRPDDYGANLVVHETGHLLGLPDLYSYAAETYETRRGAVGLWDVMSMVAPGKRFLGWHLWKLGWLDDEDVDCLGEVSLERRVVPENVDDGAQLLVTPLDGSRLLFVEARRSAGIDAGLCEEGVLVYIVDVDVRGGRDPVRVRRAREDRDPMLASWLECGLRYESTFASGPGRVASFYDLESGVAVQVSTAAEAYRVRMDRYTSS